MVADADVARFVAAVPPDKLDGDAATLLGDFIDRGRARFPDVAVDDATLIAALAEKLPAWSTVREAVNGLDAGELYLACGCEQADPRALACFEAAYFPAIKTALAPMKLPTGADDEVRQRVRTKLLVGDKLRAYAGQGALANLVRVIAVRAALDMLRESRREQRVDVVEEILAIDVSPELQIVKQRYREPFKRAFGAIYKVHRGTAARWLEAIRDKLGERTREILGDELALEPSELESIVRAIQSQVSVTLSGLLD